MAYSDEAAILEILPSTEVAQLTDDSTGSTIDSAKVSAALTRGFNTINTYLRGKASAIPLSPVPPAVKDWNTILAIFNLYQRRVDLELPETIEKSYDRVIGELKGVRDGKILMDDPIGVGNTAKIYKGSGSDKGVIFDSNAAGTGVLDGYYDGP